MLRFLIDECLHTSLPEVAHHAGHAADHVAHLGLASCKDWELMKLIVERDYTFVTNNRVDFLTLFEGAALHAGLVILIPSLGPVFQRELFRAVLEDLGDRTLVNTVIEVKYEGDGIDIRKYSFPGE